MAGCWILRGLDGPTLLPVAMQGELVSRPIARVLELTTSCDWLCLACGGGLVPVYALGCESKRPTQIIGKAVATTKARGSLQLSVDVDPVFASVPTRTMSS